MAKEKKSLPDLSEYRFTRITDPFVLPPFDYPLHLTSPLRDGTPKRGIPSITELALLLGLFEAHSSVHEFLTNRRRQLTGYKVWYTFLTWGGYFLIAIPILITGVIMLGLFNIAGSEINAYASASVSILIGYVAFVLSQKVVSVILDRRYADTLACIACLYLLVNLAKKDALTDPRDRRNLLRRVRALRRYLILLPYQAGIADTSHHSAANEKFRLMRQFAEDVENEIIIPSIDSQIELFFKTRSFFGFLLSSTFGEFKYQRTAAPETPPASETSRGILGGILKFLGTITPVVILVLMIGFPDAVKSLGIETNVLSYVALAWLLLAIDATLKLGIVERLSSLVKTIKDLS